MVDRLNHDLRASPSGHGMVAAARYYHARDYAEAERCCLELIASDARHFDALHLLGVVCLDRAQYPDAVDQQAEPHLRRALALRPNDPATLNNLGNVVAAVGKHEDAIQCFRQVLAIQSRFAPAHYNLGQSLAALDRLEEAVVSFGAALENASGADPD